MQDLTPRQMAELSTILSEFCQDRALDGFRCIVLLSGRDINKAAFSQDTAPYAPTMLAATYRDIRAHNASKAN